MRVAWISSSWIAVSCLALLACGSPTADVPPENASEPTQGGANDSSAETETETVPDDGTPDALTACATDADCVVIGRDCCACDPGWIAVHRGAEEELYRRTCGETPICSPCQRHETPPHIRAVCQPAGRCVLQPGTPTEAVPMLRLELLHPTMRVGSDPDVDINARLDARLLVRNASASPLTVSTTTYAAFMLQWSILGEQGGVFEPTFLPPPMPPEGGVPPRTVTIPPGAERVLAELSGVSGYHRRGDSSEWLRVLPPGRYRVTVSGVTLAGMPPLTSGPATLIVSEP